MSAVITQIPPQKVFEHLNDLESIPFQSRVLASSTLSNFLRVALWNQSLMSPRCIPEPIHVTRVIGQVVKRLDTLHERDNIVSVACREALNGLCLIGDAVHIGNGYHLPTASRLIQWSQNLQLVVGGLPNNVLEYQLDKRTIKYTSGRFFDSFPESNLSKQAFVSWMKLPALDIRSWTEMQCKLPLKSCDYENPDWEVYLPWERRARTQSNRWVKLNAFTSAKPTIQLCREMAGLTNHRTVYLARVVNRANNVRITGIRELTNRDERRRVRLGLDIINNVENNFRFLRENQFGKIRVGDFYPSEIMRVLTALAFHIKNIRQREWEFLVHESVLPVLSEKLQIFGIKLT